MCCETPSKLQNGYRSVDQMLGKVLVLTANTEVTCAGGGLLIILQMFQLFFRVDHSGPSPDSTLVFSVPYNRESSIG